MKELIGNFKDVYKESLGINKGIVEVVLRSIVWGLGFACLDIILSISTTGFFDPNEILGTLFFFYMIFIPARFILAKLVS